MADEVRMPSGMGGIVRYEGDSKLKIKPYWIVVGIVLAIIFEVMLRVFWKTA